MTHTMRLPRCLHFLRTLLACLTVSLIAACGGGGGGSSTPATPAPPAPLTVTTATAAAHVGDEFTVTGTGLDRVRQARLAGTDLPIVAGSLSATSLRVRLPASPITGVLEVSDGTATAAAVGTLVVYASGPGPRVAPPLPPQLPLVTSVDRTSAPAGQLITVTGSALDRVIRFSIGATELPRSSEPGGVSSTSVRLIAPAADADGRLDLQDVDGRRYTAAQALQTYVPVTVTGFAPVEAVAGMTVTVTGSRLDTVTQVRIGSAGSSTTAPVATQSATQLTFVVPAGATTGAIALTGRLPEAVTTDLLAVYPTVAVTNLSAVRTTDGTQTYLRVTGQHLDRVRGVTVGGRPASITSRAGGALVATAQAAADGEVVLDVPVQGAVPAGQFIASGAAAITAAELMVAQVYQRAASDTSLRLTPDKPALIRWALTVPNQADWVPSPQVTLTATLGGAVIGSMPMNGPPVLPAQVPETSIDLAFSAAIPSAWVRPGVRLFAQAAGLMEATAAPAVSAQTMLDIVLIPIHIGGLVPRVLDVDKLQDEVVRVYAVPRSQLRITYGTPMVWTGEPIRNSPESRAMGNMLRDLMLRRRAEAPFRLYVGVLPTAAIERGHPLGMALMPAPNSLHFPVSTYPSVALFSDEASAEPLAPEYTPFGIRNDGATAGFLHELGHLLALYHAPCGGADILYPYPYPDGELGPQVLHNSTFRDGDPGQLASPSTNGKMAVDLMSYCRGAVHVSDHHYNVSQRFLERYTAWRLAEDPTARPLSGAASVKAKASSTAAAAAAARSSATRTLHVHAVITTAGVRILPTRYSEIPPEPLPAQADWVLRLTLASGQQILVPMLAMRIETHRPDETLLLEAAVPDPGSVSVVEVIHRGQAVAPAMALPMRQ